MKIKPSGLYYLIPVLTLLIGVAAFVLILVFNIKNIVQASATLKAGNDITFEVEEAGTYYIYVENIAKENASLYRTDMSTKTVRFNTIEGFVYMNLSIYKEGDSSQTVEISALPSNFSMEMNAFQAFLEIEFDEPGTYIIDTEFTTDNTTIPTSEINLMVSNMNAFSIVGFVFLGIGILFVTFVISLISFILIITKRAKNRKLQYQANTTNTTNPTYN